MRDTELDSLQEDFRGHQKESGYQMLIAWKKKRYKEATYKILSEALRQANRADLAEYVKQEGEKTTGLRITLSKMHISTY